MPTFNSRFNSSARRWLRIRALARARQRVARKHGEALYQRALTLSRSPHLFLRFQLPDTPDGRLDALILHLFFYAHRFADEQPERVRTMTEAFITHLDLALREMGVGDLSVAKKVKRILCCLYGAFESYRAARSALEWQAALQRNIFHSSASSPQALSALASYCRASTRALERQALWQVLLQQKQALPEASVE